MKIVLSFRCSQTFSCIDCRLKTTVGGGGRTIQEASWQNSEQTDKQKEKDRGKEKKRENRKGKDRKKERLARRSNGQKKEVKKLL